MTVGQRKQPDIRCADCRAIGCECPRGYVAPRCRCLTCRGRFVMAAPGCVDLSEFPCPFCGGSLEVLPDPDASDRIQPPGS